ncbi:MAG: sigma-70 family RNA polymerase sigma factor [Desulfobacterales bacterium]|nr:sigma-70 family RNA polymerase sigma factor [Desulfobacterales bacterium]
MTEDEKHLVRTIATQVYYRYCHGSNFISMSREGAYHHGIVGFLTAKKAYRKETGVPFEKWAAIKIRGAIIDELRKRGMIRLPQEKQRLIREYTHAKTFLLQRGESASVADIAEFLEWSPKQVMDVEFAFVSIVYMGDNPALEPADDQDAEHWVNSRQLAATMQKCLDGIENPREKFIFVHRVWNEHLGKASAAGAKLKRVTLKTLGDQFGCSVEKIRQHELAAKRQMRECLEKNDIQVRG